MSSVPTLIKLEISPSTSSVTVGKLGVRSKEFRYALLCNVFIYGDAPMGLTSDDSILVLSSAGLTL